MSIIRRRRSKRTFHTSDNIEANHSRSYASMEQRGGWQETVTADLAEFISQRDSFYLGTASADGQPYIQHRGGSRGFLKVLDDRTLAFADFVGNAQYISTGNLDENPKAFIFLMDYPNRRRIKLWGTAEFVEGDDELLSRLTDPEYRGKPQRAFVFHIEAWDVNCPQHIKPRWTDEEFAPVVAELRAAVDRLEGDNRRLRKQLADHGAQTVAR